MFKPSDVIIDAFVGRMLASYERSFPEGVPGHRETLAQVARMALARMTFTNALYTNLEMVLLTTQVANAVLEGRMIARGDVRSDDWLNFLTAAMCFCSGFVRGTLPEDNGRICQVDASGKTITLEHGQTDGVLYPWATQRSCLFVEQYFGNHPHIDSRVVSECIAATHFPFPQDANHDTGNWPGLLRGSQTISVAGDPRFHQRIKFFYMQLDEAGLAEGMQLHSRAEMIDSYPMHFWRGLYPQTPDTIHYLKFTADGSSYLASMNARMLDLEHKDDPVAGSGNT